MELRPDEPHGGHQCTAPLRYGLPSVHSQRTPLMASSLFCPPSDEFEFLTEPWVKWVSDPETSTQNTRFRRS
jgi:hypothetical protein